MFNRVFGADVVVVVVFNRVFNRVFGADVLVVVVFTHLAWLDGCKW